MSKKTKINLIGWLFLIFLGISKAFFDEQLSIITTGLGGVNARIKLTVFARYDFTLLPKNQNRTPID